MVRESPPEPAPPHEPRHEPPPYPAVKARGATINLRTRPRIVVFMAGLVGMVVLVWLLGLFG